MKREALFCDGTANYVSPAEPKANETVKLWFRTAANDAEYVFLLVNGEGHTLKKEKTSGLFDYYATEWKLGEELFRYSFMVQNKDEVLYYNQCGVTEERQNGYEFEIMPGFSTPDWAKGAVMYQIFTDRFYNGDTTNDVEDGEYIYIKRPSVKVKDWNKYPAVTGEEGVGEFYGGDLQGVLDKLDYLQDLGVEVIYFNPLFVSPSCHKYDIQDYDHIDPHFGVIAEDGGNLLPEGASKNIYATKYQKRVADKKNLDASKAALIGMYHDTTEIITGDMPTPVKYYNETIQTVFHKIEDAAAETLLSMLPEDLREEFNSLYFKQEEDAYLWRLVKAADKFSALIKCMEEKKAGNKEFDSAFESTKASIIAMELPEADCFMEEFIPAYNKNLDELQKR
jgi:5'-deoxynucleotidase YfbR-like HD superfamily hydrolase